MLDVKGEGPLGLTFLVSSRGVKASSFLQAYLASSAPCACNDKNPEKETSMSRNKNITSTITQHYQQCLVTVLAVAVAVTS
jgi:hypothetical protein